MFGPTIHESREVKTVVLTYLLGFRTTERIVGMHHKDKTLIDDHHRLYT